MTSLFDDTDPMIEARQIARLRQAGQSGRLRIGRSLSRTASRLCKQALRRRNPALGEDEVLDRFIALNYGDELAERVSSARAARKR